MYRRLPARAHLLLTLTIEDWPTERVLYEILLVTLFWDGQLYRRHKSNTPVILFLADTHEKARPTHRQDHVQSPTTAQYPVRSLLFISLYLPHVGSFSLTTRRHTACKRQCRSITHTYKAIMRFVATCYRFESPQLILSPMPICPCESHRHIFARLVRYSTRTLRAWLRYAWLRCVSDAHVNAMQSIGVTWWSSDGNIATGDDDGDKRNYAGMMNLEGVRLRWRWGNLPIAATPAGRRGNFRPKG